MSWFQTKKRKVERMERWFWKNEAYPFYEFAHDQVKKGVDERIDLRDVEKGYWIVGKRNDYLSGYVNNIMVFAFPMRHGRVEARTSILVDGIWIEADLSFSSLVQEIMSFVSDEEEGKQKAIRLLETEAIKKRLRKEVGG